MMTRISCSFVVITAITLQIQAASVVLDQQQLDVSQTFSLGNSGANSVQQKIVSGIAGSLTGFDLWFLPFLGSSVPETSVVDFFVDIGSPWQTGIHDFQISLSVLPSDRGHWFHVNTSLSNIVLAQGQDFTIGLRPQAQTTAFVFMIGLPFPETYPSGSLYFNGDATTYNSHDMAFRTYMAVPETSTLCLATIGITVLFCRRSRPGKGVGGQTVRH